MVNLMGKTRENAEKTLRLLAFAYAWVFWPFPPLEGAWPFSPGPMAAGSFGVGAPKRPWARP